MTPIGSDRDILCIICHSCSSVVGTLHHHDSGEELKVMNRQIEELNQSVGEIRANFKHLTNVLNKIYNQKGFLKPN